MPLSFADMHRCKHLCCREGVDKPPKRAPKALSEAKEDKSSKTQMRPKSKLDGSARIDDLLRSACLSREDDTQPAGLKSLNSKRKKQSDPCSAINNLRKLQRSPCTTFQTSLQRDREESPDVEHSSTKRRPLAWLDNPPPRSRRQEKEKASEADDVSMSNFPSPSALFSDIENSDLRHSREPLNTETGAERQQDSHLHSPSIADLGNSDTAFQARGTKDDPFSLEEDYALDFAVYSPNLGTKARESPPPKTRGSPHLAAGDFDRKSITGMQLGFHDTSDGASQGLFPEPENLSAEGFPESDTGLGDKECLKDTLDRTNYSPHDADLPHAKRRRIDGEGGQPQAQDRLSFWFPGLPKTKVAKSRPFKDMTGIDLNLLAEFEDIADFVD